MEVENFVSLAVAPPLDTSAAQITFPLVSVVSLPPLLKPEQAELPSVEKVRPPLVSTIPLMVEEAVVFRRDAENPPAKVEVATLLVALNVEADTNPPKTPFAETSTRPEKVDVAVVEVAKNLEAPIIGDSSPEANVEVAVDVATKAPAVKGLYVRALTIETELPKATVPPPPMPRPALTVTDEFAKLVFVMTAGLVSDPIDKPPESERAVP